MIVISQRAVVVVLLGATGCVSSPASRDHDIVNYEFPEARAEIEAEMRTMDELAISLESLRNLHLESPKFSKLVHDEPRMGFEEMLAQEWANVSALEGLSIDWRDLKIDVFGDVAVATSFPHFVLRPPNGEPMELDLVGTLVWVRTHDGWKIAHENNFLVEDIVEDPFPAEQAELRLVVDEIARDAVAGNARDLEEIHLVSDKFTKFGSRHFDRQNLQRTLETEAAFAGNIGGFVYEPRDLKIDVFGDVAVVTYYPYVSYLRDGLRVERTDRQTLVFVKTSGEWRIVHEHHSTREPSWIHG